MSVTIDRYENRAKGVTFLEDLTQRFVTWNRSIRAVGGFAYGESEYQGDPWELQQFFDTALFNRIVERGGGVATWEGFISEMTLTYSNGDKVVRSRGPWYNRTRTIFSKIFPNVLGANWSVEAGPWTNINVAPICAQDPAWYTNGVWGAHVITGGAGQGCEVEANVAIAINRAYDVRVDVKVDAGEWILYIYDTGTADVVAQRASANDGEETLRCQIPESNTIANIDMQLIESTGAGEIWADAATIRLVSERATTTWYENASSMGELGTRELIIAKDGMSDTAARALAEQELAKRAWPRSRASEDPILVSFDEPPQIPAEAGPVHLMASVNGYMDTLKWKYVSSTEGTDTITNLLTALIAESEFITAGSIGTNATDQKVEAVDIPRTLWSMIEKLVESGEDGDTTPWMGGVYVGRQFYYAQRPTDISMFREGSTVIGLSGEPIMPYNLRPGLIQLLGTSSGDGPTGLDQDRPDVEFIREVEYDMPSNTARLIREKDKLE